MLLVDTQVKTQVESQMYAAYPTYSAPPALPSLSPDVSSLYPTRKVRDLSNVAVSIAPADFGSW